MERISSSRRRRGRGVGRLSGLVVAIAAATVVAAGRASAQPIYQWQFSEWREMEHLGGLAATLVREPRHEQVGDYLLESWDLLAPTFLGEAAFLTAVGHTDGKIFWAKALAPLRGGVAGNTIGGEAFILVMKDYVKTSEQSLLRFAYSAANVTLVDYGSGRPPWFGPSASIEMDVSVLDFESRHRWGIRQGVRAHADLGISLDDLADDTWQLDLSGEMRGEDAQPVASGARWSWDCATCGTPAYGVHQAKLVAPYAEIVDLSPVPLYTGFTVWFALKVDALDRGQGETAARAFAKDPLSDDDLLAAGIDLDVPGATAVAPAPPCPDGLAGAACLLGGMPPAACTAGELPAPVLRRLGRAQSLLDGARVATTDKKRRGLAKRARAGLVAADRKLARLANAKRGTKPSLPCTAEALAVLQRAAARLRPLACDPAAGTIAFVASEHQVAEGAGDIDVTLVRTGGSKGTLTALLLPELDTATQGADYLRPPASVTFANRETGPRVVRVPIADDRYGEPDERLSLRLTLAGGCAPGTPAATTITIADDDWLPPPPSYPIGGTVSGLEGTGLVLRDAVSAQEVTPANGSFALPVAVPDGSAYDVRVATQPHDPPQTCTVVHGSGVVAGGDVTSVVVTCVTLNPAGGLDPGFGNGGRVGGGWTASVRALAQQADGTLLALGARRLARYATDGTLDPTFGTGGIVEIAFGSGLDVDAQDVVVQPDGRILVAGHVGARFGSPPDFAVARYDASGVLDASFGSGGAVVTDFDGSTDRAYRILLQDDGRIVLAGHAAALGDNDFAVARYDASGVLDPTFGHGGTATTNVAGATDLARAAALQADGAIVLAGRVAASGGDDPDVGVVRYTRDGALDAAFGQNGVVRVDLSGGAWDEASDVALAPDGGIVLAVQALLGSTFDYVVARLLPSGALDPSFGAGGSVATPFASGDDYVRALLVRDDGAILVAGQASSTTVSDFGLARYAADGTPDASFGAGGTLAIDLFGAGDGAQCLLLQADGRLVAGGSARNGGIVEAALVRLAP